MTTKVISKTKEEFQTRRSKGIGSSDIAVITGVSPWKTPYQLWREKTGKDNPDYSNEFTEAGHKIEPVVAEYFQDRSGHRVIKNTEPDYMVKHDVHDFIRVHPDREYFAKDKSGRGTLECKTKYYQTPEKGSLPLDWYAQNQYQMGTLKQKFGAIAWISFSFGISFDYEEFELSPEYYDYLVNEAGDFWNNHVLKDIPPDPLTGEDVQKRWPEHQAGLSIEASSELYETYRKAYELKQRISHLKSDLERYEEEIKLACGPSEMIRFDNKVLVTFKAPKQSYMFDWKAFKEADPDTYNHYLKPRKASRRLLIKSPK